MEASVQKAHAKLSASGSEIWLNCSGAPALSEQAPEQEGSEYATEGTDAHSCLEFLMKNLGNKSARKMALKKWSLEMVEHAENAIEYIRRFETPGSELHCETRSDISELMGEEEMFGTLDASLIEEFADLHIFDYKYGAGLEVDVVENTQLIYYALGIAHRYSFNFERIFLHVIQPRIQWLDHEGVKHTGKNSFWQMSMDELIIWEKKFRDGVQRTKDKKAPLASGDWCRWCRAKPICPEISNAALKQAQIDFSPEHSSEMALPIPNMMKPEVVSNVLKGLKKLKMWTESVEEHALSIAKAGIKIPGYKLVNKRSTRKWTDSESAKLKAELAFGPIAFDYDLKSPAQLEKVYGKKIPPKVEAFINKYSSSESSGVTIAPESDNRPEVSLIEQDFPAIETEEVVVRAVKVLVEAPKKGTINFPRPKAKKGKRK